MAAPAFQFYPNAFLGGTFTMTNAERGLYISLLCVQWDKGFVTRQDVKSLARSHGSAMAQLSLKHVEAKFVVGPDGHLRNARLEKERAKQESFRRERQQSGTKGSLSRWGAIGKSMAEPMAQPLAQPLAEPMANTMANDSSLSLSLISGCTEREREGGPAPNSEVQSVAAASPHLAAMVKAGAIRFGALSSQIKYLEALRARKELDDVGRAELKKLRAELAELQKKHAAGDFES